MSIEMRILIVDDEPDLRELLQSLLEPEHDVETCGSGREALQLIEANPPDLVITDHMMAVPWGLELIQRARQVASSTQFILITGMGSSRQRAEALRLGAADYFEKPVHLERLKARVLELSKQKRGSTTAQPFTPRPSDGDDVTELFKKIRAGNISLEGALYVVERELLQKAVNSVGKDYGKAAQLLGISPVTLLEKIARRR